MVKAISANVDPSTVEYAYRLVASVFRAAVLDKVVTASPCVKVALPKIDRPKVAPLPVEGVEALAAAVPAAIGLRSSWRPVGPADGRGARPHGRPGRLPACGRDRRPPARHPARRAGRVLAPPKTSASSRVVPWAGS